MLSFLSHDLTIIDIQKTLNLLENTTNQLYILRTKTWEETNYDVPGLYNMNSQIKFKITISTSSLCDYNDVHILLKETITVVGQSEDATVIAADRSKNINNI